MSTLPLRSSSVSVVAQCACATQPIAIVAGGVDAVPVVVEGATAREGSIEAFLLARIDGCRTIAELAVLGGLTPREVLHLVTGMVLQGAVEIVSHSSVRASIVAPRIDPRAEPAAPEGDFIDFSDVLEEVERAAAGE